MDKASNPYKIIAMHVIDGHRSASGNRLLATFDLKVAGVRINGCLLVEGANGRAICHGPVGKTHNGKDVSAEFTHPEVRRTVTRLSAEAFSAMTGRSVRQD